MQQIAYLHLYPAQDTLCAGEPLNVMFAAKNMLPDNFRAQLRLWLCPAEGDADWRLAAEREQEMPGRRIEHIYMQIGREAFLPDFWNGQTHEEFLLLCADAPPKGKPAKNCTALLFVRH